MSVPLAVRVALAPGHKAEFVGVTETTRCAITETVITADPVQVPADPITL